jgi:hypothetical protein
MPQLPLVLVGSTRCGALGALRSRVLLASLTLLVTGCASQPLITKDQADAIKRRDRALAPHADAIQAAIRQSGDTGVLAFLDANDGRLVVLPGETAADAWARHTASPDSAAGQVSVPAVVTFVHRADVPSAPEVVTLSALQQQQGLRMSLAALETEVRDAQRRTEERLGMIQRELAESVATTKQEMAAARADMQQALSSLAEELAAARKLVLQTAQLGRLNQELNVENANSIRKMETASQQLTATSARLAGTIQQLSESLASHLKELTSRLDAIQSKVGEIK